MTLSSKQAGVLRGIVIGAAITLIAIVGCIVVGFEPIPPDSTVARKIEFSLKSDILIVLWLGISIGLLARHRFFSAQDIDGGGLANGTTRARILQATLQNTLEQSILAVLVHAIWAVSVPISWLTAIWAAVALFLVGRVLFVTGYDKGAPSRAVGFALTFYPTMVMLFIAGFYVVRESFN